MAEALFLVTKSASNLNQTINGVRAMVINKDDAQTNSQVIAAAIKQANAKFDPSGPAPTPITAANYFDTVVNISDLATGPLKDNEDAYIFIEGSDPVKVEGA